MKPVEFEGQNVVFGANQPEYNPLPAFVEETPEGRVVQCWELTEEDIEKILETKRIWVMQMTFGKALQPICIQVEPLIEIKPDPDVRDN